MEDLLANMREERNEDRVVREDYKHVLDVPAVLCQAKAKTMHEDDGPRTSSCVPGGRQA